MLEEYFLSIENATGIASDYWRFFFCLNITIVIGYPYQLIARTPTMKHSLNFIIGIFYICFIWNDLKSWIHGFVDSTICYLIAYFLGKKRAALSSKLICIFANAYLSSCYIYVAFYPQNGLTDFTVYLMILTLKLSAFGFNYADGVVEGHAVEDLMKQRAISRLPSLLEYYGWIFFFPTLLCGPKIEITDYLEYCNSTKEPPASFKATLIPFLKSLCFLPCIALFDHFHPTYLLTDEFLHDSLFFRYVIAFYLYTVFGRAKYYVCWYIAESGANSTGFGFNPATNSWDRCRGMIWTKVEFPENPRSIMTGWNMSVQDWMRNYIYLRLIYSGCNIAIATIITNLVSAFWHGFEWGYYLFFFWLAIISEIAKDCRRKIRPYFMKNDEVGNYPIKYVYDILGSILSLWSFSYAGAAMLLLTKESCWIAYTNVHFFGHIILFLTFILLRFIIPSPRRRSQKVQ